MLREIINRSEILDPEYEEEVSYFPEVNVVNPKFSRETSLHLPEFTLRNFAFYDRNTNLMMLDFSVLPIEPEEKINFVASVGCQMQHQKFGIIDISYQPLTIINGVQYYFLRTDTCNAETIRILYPLCEFIYINETMLPELQSNLYNIFDVSETWDIKNSLYVVSRGFSESDSLVKTSAESKELNSLSGLGLIGEQPDHSHFHKRKQATSVFKLEKFFTEISHINQSFMDLNDYSSIRDRLQEGVSTRTSRWYSQQGLKESCARLFVSQKHYPIKQFYHINNMAILNDLQQRVQENYKIYSFQTVRVGNVKKDHLILEKNQEDSDDMEMERVKEKKKLIDKLRKIKQSIMHPFYEAEETWLGRTDAFKEKSKQVLEMMREAYNKLLNTIDERDENLAIENLDQALKNQTCLQVFANTEIDFINIRFENFMGKIQSSLGEMLKMNGRRDWKKGKVSNQDVLRRLDERIRINEIKKEGIENAIRLAQQEHEYLSEHIFPNRQKKMAAFQIEK